MCHPDEIIRTDIALRKVYEKLLVTIVFVVCDALEKVKFDHEGTIPRLLRKKRFFSRQFEDMSV